MCNLQVKTHVRIIYMNNSKHIEDKGSNDLYVRMVHIKSSKHKLNMNEKLVEGHTH
jgi:hypothetical protein